MFLFILGFFLLCSWLFALPQMLKYTYQGHREIMVKIT